MRPPRFLGVRRDRIEADEREEYDRRPEHDPRQAVGRKRAARGVVDRQQPAIQTEHSQQAPRADRLLPPLRFDLRQELFDNRLVSHRRQVRSDLGLNVPAACIRFLAAQAAGLQQPLVLLTHPRQAVAGGQLPFQGLLAKPEFGRGRIRSRASGRQEVFLDQSGQHALLRQHPLGDWHLRPIARIDIADSHRDDEQHHRHLDDHQHRIGSGALANAQHQHHRDHCHDQHCGQVEPRLASQTFHRGERI